MPRPSLHPVPERPPALQFAECVRAVTAVARRRGLVVPVFRSPPRAQGLDRSIRRRRDGGAVVSVRLGSRPLAAVQSDVIDGVVAANGLDGPAADRFRRAAWAAVEGRPVPSSGRGRPGGGERARRRPVATPARPGRASGGGPEPGVRVA